MPKYVKTNKYTPQQGDVVLGYTNHPILRKNWKIITLTLILLGIGIWMLCLPNTNKEGLMEQEHIRTHTILFEQNTLQDYFTSCRWNSYYKDNKENGLLCLRQAEMFEMIETPYTPFELFYGFPITDNAYITQDRFEHAKTNGLLADDIGTGGKALDIYAPDLYNEVMDWEVTEEVNKLKGNTIIFTSGVNRFEYGHSKLTVGEGIVATGEAVGKVLCPGEENAGISTGCHIHVSYLVNDGINWNQTEYKVDKNYNADKNLEEKLEKKKIVEEERIDSNIVHFTTYNAEESQTDGNPCQGAWGNVCELYKQGLNPIALDRGQIQATSELMESVGYCTENCPYRYGDIVLVTPLEHWQTPFEAIVADTMNDRYTGKLRGDLFKDDRSKNTSFDATIKLINK